MPLSIRNEKAEKLARKVASLSDETITEAIIHALEERLERITGRRQAPDLMEDINTISRRCSNLPDLDTRTPDEILGYNDNGVFDGH